MVQMKPTEITTLPVTTLLMSYPGDINVTARPSYKRGYAVHYNKVSIFLPNRENAIIINVNPATQLMAIENKNQLSIMRGYYAALGLDRQLADDFKAYCQEFFTSLLN